jgi:ketosteroid isomerase-like protein
MNKDNVAIAQAYYTALGEKNIAKMEKYLHPDIYFIRPFGEVKGKEPFSKPLRNSSLFFRL